MNSALKLFDSHSHLHDDSFRDDRNELITSISESDICGLMTVGDNLESSEKAAELALQHPFIVASAGIHPHHAKSYTSTDKRVLTELIDKYKFHAFGEIGLDFHYDFAERDEQLFLLEEMLDIWLNNELPLIIHNRKSEKDMLSVLKNFSNSEYRGVIHCFDADIKSAGLFLDMGFNISFSGMITFKKAELLRKIVAYVPLDRLLIETDCPYLSPHPNRGKRNSPLNVRYVAEKVAEIKNLPLTEIAGQTTANAINLYKIEDLS